MINFDEEIKNYEPSLEIEEAESAIYSHDLTDVTDIIAQLLREQDKRQRYLPLLFSTSVFSGW